MSDRKKQVWQVFCSMALVTVFLLCFPESGRSWSGKVVQAESGDTFRVRRGKRIVRVRLYGIDAPEKGQPMAEQAARFAVMLVRGKDVMGETIDTDVNGREICLLWAGSTVTVNGTLVERGYAWIDDMECQRPMCSDWRPLLDTARKRRAGVWREKDPTPPWVYRVKQNVQKP